MAPLLPRRKSVPDLNSVGAARFGRLLCNQVSGHKSKKCDTGNPTSSTVSQHLAKTTPDSIYLKACYINARSLRNKFEDLQILAATDDYDIVGVTESWSNRVVAKYRK